MALIKSHIAYKQRLLSRHCLDGSFVSKCASSSIFQHRNFPLQIFDKTDYLSSLTVSCFSKGEILIQTIGCFPTRHVQKTSQLRPHVDQTHTQLVTPSLPRKRRSPSTIHLPNDSISLIGARASTSDGRPRPTRAQRQKPILSSKQVSDQRDGRIEGGRQTRRAGR